MSTLTIQPCEFDEACSFVLKHHRHHPPPIRCKFHIADRAIVLGALVMVAGFICPDRHLLAGFTVGVLAAMVARRVRARQHG